MEEEDTPPSINFIPCVRWIRKGVAKSNPVKVELSKQELEDIIKETKNSLHLDDADDDSGNENDEVEPEPESHAAANDEFDMENYDEEGEEAEVKVGDVAVYDSNDPYTSNIDDGPDSDAEDDIIKPEDNLIAVAHVEGDASILEIYVYNDYEDCLYVHHDLILPSVPLALEWLNYDPKDVNTPVNLCAVGSMSPIIDVWDLDLVNSLVPAFKLGKKGSRKKGISRVGHQDAVLDLSWNTNLNHIMASGSADQTVLLWDLEVKEPHTSLTCFQEKIQSLKWHPFEGQTLLTGSSDKTCKVFDCRSPESFKSWVTDGEVERVIWNRLSPFYFLTSDDLGFVYCFDFRQENPLWKLSAHTKEVTGLVLSPQCPGFLATASQDGTYKTWDIEGAEPVLISQKNLKIGSIQCLDITPDSPFLLASGGDKKNNPLTVFNALEQTTVRERFEPRELRPSAPLEGIEATTSTGEPSQRTRSIPMVKKKKKKDHSLSVIKKKKKFKKLSKSP